MLLTEQKNKRTTGGGNEHRRDLQLSLFLQWPVERSSRA